MGLGWLGWVDRAAEHGRRVWLPLAAARPFTICAALQIVNGGDVHMNMRLRMIWPIAGGGDVRFCAFGVHDLQDDANRERLAPAERDRRQTLPALYVTGDTPRLPCALTRLVFRVWLR
ncbi:hypothetical protein F7D09_1277 [Bifidobacterium leontopitheci]|uniref:Uncharacterized protein n=2 Tax=Bifidobacterium leontopitheci TaxID=2650774 RepID=A0A6I1GF84_9BIFI|nr:hypothetical protein F7D09_1277 [Bifidobacterium leontopitheci]